MYSESEEGLGLPTDLVGQLVHYLSDDSVHLFRYDPSRRAKNPLKPKLFSLNFTRFIPFRLRLCSKRWMERVIPLIDYVDIYCVEKPFPSAFLGCQPRKVEVWDFPETDEEAQALGSILTQAKELDFRVNHPTRKPTPALANIGPQLSNITKLQFTVGHSEVDSPEVLVQWLPHLKKLESLEIIWRPNTVVEIIAAVSKHCQLRDLILRSSDLETVAFGEARSVGQIAQYLQSMTSLSSVLMEAECSEVMEIVVMGEESIAHMEHALQTLSDHMPPQLKNLHGVYVRIGAQTRPEFFDIPLYGFLYASVSRQGSQKYILEKIKEMGPNSSYFDGDTALTYCLTVPISPAGLLSLIGAGADIWKRVPIYISQEEGSILGNAFHVAALFSPPLVAEELLKAVDWTQITDILQFKASGGYTPLHLSGSHTGTWEVFYNSLKQHFPDILRESDNIRHATPLLSLHTKRERDTVNSEAVVTAALAILKEDPLVVDLSSGLNVSLFGQVFDFYSQFMGEGTLAIDKCESLLKQLLTHHCQKYGFQSVKSIDTASFCFEGKGWVPQALRLLGAMQFDMDLFNLLLKVSHPDALSACLNNVVGLSAAKTRLEPMVKHLLELGANINFANTNLNEGLSALLVYGISQVPRDENEDEENEDEPPPVTPERHAELREQWKAFWNGFWFLVDSGSVISEDANPYVFTNRINPEYSHPINDILRLALMLRKISNSAQYIYLMETVNMRSHDYEGDKKTCYETLVAELLRMLHERDYEFPESTKDTLTKMFEEMHQPKQE